MVRVRQVVVEDSIKGQWMSVGLCRNEEDGRCTEKQEGHRQSCKHDLEDMEAPGTAAYLVRGPLKIITTNSEICHKLQFARYMFPFNATF